MFGQPSYLGVATADWVAALKSSDSLERRLAAHALAEIGRTAREEVPALTEALRDSESFVRVWAAAALARVEPENPDAIPALVAGTRDGIYFVRSLAAWHLGRLGPRHPGIEAAVPELRELLNDNDPRSEEHTSELQSQSNIVCRLLLEKKNTNFYFIIISLASSNFRLWKMSYIKS